LNGKAKFDRTSFVSHAALSYVRRSSGGLVIRASISSAQVDNQVLGKFIEGFRKDGTL
jgi:hypothetical protein